MPDFSIKIVPVGPGVAAFQPDLPNAKPGDPLMVPPESRISWDNQTDIPHQVVLDDGSYTSNEIASQLSSQTDYVLPASAQTVTYHCAQHPHEKGSIVVVPVVNIPPLAGIATVLFALGLGALSALPAQAQPTRAPATPPSATSQIACLPQQQPLVRIPEVVARNGRLRATLIAGTEQVRMPSRYPLQFDGKPSQPGDPETFAGCVPEWVRTFRSPDTTTPVPGPAAGMADPFPGPTLRARVGDFIELTLLNQIDPSKFGRSIDLGDNGACDASSAHYPGSPGPDGHPTGAGDSFPDCFHGSTTANIHFHGTHTNPGTTGDNVFLEILSAKRLSGPPMPPVPSFDAFFARCEAELSKGPHVEWPVSWNDLPKAYTDQQRQLLQRFDAQPTTGTKLWPANQAALDHNHWPQYYIGSYPYCYQLPKSAGPRTSTGGGMAMTHPGMAPPATVPPGGALRMAQSPGTHWYHAHKHGSTAIDVANGFVGAFIIEGHYDDEINALYGKDWTRSQPVLVINQFGTSPNLKGGAKQDKGPDFSVNGRTNPIIAMKPGEVQMWRILNASGRAGAFFLAPPAGLNWKVMAIDGVQLFTDNYTASGNKPFLLAPGNRIDLLVQAGPCATPDGCIYPVQVHNLVDPSDLTPATPPARGPFRISLATVKVAGSPVTMPFPDASPAKTFPADLSDITDGEVKGTQTVDFGTVPQSFTNGPPPASPAAIHTINGKKFDGEVGVSVLLNNVEEWKITNNTPNISHPFHIHINPFQVTEVFAPNATLADGITPMYVFSTVSTTALKPGQCLVNPSDQTTWKPCAPTAPAMRKVWWDVFPIPSAHHIKDSVTINGYFKLRSRFVDYPGYFVIHCHILAHEDRGMMTVVNVTPLRPPFSHH